MSITTNPKLWTTWANGSLIDHPNLYAEGYMLTDKAVDGEVNAFDSMKFSVPAEHPLYDTIKKIGTIIEAYDGNELGFRGRVMDTSREFDNTISVYCEGQLAFFCDTVMEPFAFKGTVETFLTKIIENHNSQVDDSRKFEVGTITVTDPDDNGVLVRSSEKPLTSWEMIQNRLIDTLGGYIRVRKTKTGFAVDYLAEFVDVCDQVVKCGENLLDLEEYITADEVVTCLLPLGAKIEEDGTNENDTDKYQELPEEAGATYMRNWYGSRVTVRSVNDGEAYVEDPDGVALWGKIYGTNTWDDVTEPANLLRKAKEYLSENVKSSITMTINAVDLHLVDVDIGRIHVGDLVKVYSSAHRLNRYMACIGTHKEPSDPAKNTITLGSTVKTLTQSLSGGSSLKTRIYALEGDSEYQGEQIDEHLKMLQAQAKEMKDLATHIENLQSDYAEITKLVATKATIEQLEAVEAYITNLDAEKASIKELEAAVASIHKLLADYATIDHLEANYATIERLEAVVGSFETLLADYATIDHLEANYATIDKLNTDLANIKKLFADYARIDSLDAKYANIDFANIGMAAVDKLFSKSGIIKDLVVGDTSITGELVGVTIKGDLIEGNTIKADKLVVKGSDGLYYKLNVDAETVEAKQTDENSLNGSIITAKSITASKISVKDLVAFNATIGGYHITGTSLYSGTKASADNTTRGVYMDSDGQFSVGDASNYLRFFKGSDGKYKLELSASSMIMSSGKTVEEAIAEVEGIAGTPGASVAQITRYYRMDIGSSWDGNTAGLEKIPSESENEGYYRVAPYAKIPVGGTVTIIYNGATTLITVTADMIQTFTSDDVEIEGLILEGDWIYAVPKNITIDGTTIREGTYFTLARSGNISAWVSSVSWLTLSPEKPTEYPPAGGDTVTFDGDIAGRTAIAIDSGYWFVKLSDAVITLDDLQNGCTLGYRWGEEYASAGLSGDSFSMDDDGLISSSELDSPLLLIFTRTVSEDGITLTPGVWSVYAENEDVKIYTTSLTIPGYTGFKDWDTTEPTYSAGATGTACYTDLTLLTDGTWFYSDVQELPAYSAQKKNYESTVVSVDVEYYLSTSQTELAGGSWVTTAPAWEEGKYIWTRTVMINGAGQTTYSPAEGGVCISGKSGTDGNDGKGISSVVEEYYRSTSTATPTGGSWSTTYPGWQNGTYIWTRSTITFSDGTTTTTDAVCVSGEKGDNGKDGTNGTNGKDGTNGLSIGSVVNYYLATSSSSGVTTATSGWTTTVQSVTADKKYLWNYEVVKYTDDTTASITAPCIIGTYGTDGATGNGISKITEYYAVSSSNTTAPTSWGTSIPTMTATNRYLWNYEIVTYTNGGSMTTGKRVIGVYGDTGKAGTNGTNGSDGRSVSSITPQYYLSTSKTAATGGSWSDTTPATVPKGKYLWTRLKVVYANPTTTEYTAAQYESLAESRIEQLKDSITLVVEGSDGTVASIAMDDEGHIILTGDVLAEQISVAKLFAGDITATGKIQFDNGSYSLLIDKDTGKISLKSANALSLYGYNDVTIASSGVLKLSAFDYVDILDGNLSIDGQSVTDFVVAEGTSGIWRWRKWYSGVAECWGTNTYSIDVTKTYAINSDSSKGLIYYGNVPTQEWYPFAFKTVKHAHTSVRRADTPYMWPGTFSNATSESPARVTLWNVVGSKSGVSLVVDYYCCGTYK